MTAPQVATDGSYEACRLLGLPAELREQVRLSYSKLALSQLLLIYVMCPA